MDNVPQVQDFEALAAICQRLKDLRVRVCGGRGQSHFASLLHLSPSTYNYYEKGRIPPVDVLDRASRITNAPLLWLIRGEPVDFSLTTVPPLAAQASSDGSGEAAAPSSEPHRISSGAHGASNGHAAMAENGNGSHDNREHA